MDRFIAIFNSRDFSSGQNLKSNMDRFIVFPARQTLTLILNLKSNMDRFIDLIFIESILE